VVISRPRPSFNNSRPSHSSYCRVQQRIKSGQQSLGVIIKLALIVNQPSLHLGQRRPLLTPPLIDQRLVLWGPVGSMLPFPSLNGLQPELVKLTAFQC
jgi:hypothetical protein